jgi:hypothetical protein
MSTFIRYMVSFEFGKADLKSCSLIKDMYNVIFIHRWTSWCTRSHKYLFDHLITIYRDQPFKVHLFLSKFCW